MGDYLKEAYDAVPVVDTDKYKPCYVVYDFDKPVKEFTSFEEMYSWYRDYRSITMKNSRPFVTFGVVWRLKEGAEDGI